jgi:Tol biopolymer transport system component
MNGGARIAAAGLALLAGAAPAQATSPGDNGRIFFGARDGCGVASVKVSGTGFNCVDPFGRDPAVSPDRRRIASVRGDELIEVYASDINGRGVRRLTRAPGGDPDSFAPSFSPVSARIIFMKFHGDTGESGLYLMNADGSGQHQLTGDNGLDPVFSPSGLQIAYALGGIAIADASGAGSHVILADQNRATTSPPGHYLKQNGEPSWAPGGGRLAFARRTRVDTLVCNPAPPACTGTQSDTQRDVFAMNPDGSDVRQLTSTPGFDEVDPSWSPDGRMIAYYRKPDDRGDEFGEIWVMNADGSGQRRVALGANPEWSTLQGGPGRPRLRFRFIRLSRHGRCLGRYDGWSARVKTTALRHTGFDIAFYVDGKLLDSESGTRDLGQGVDLTQARRGRTHRLRVVVKDPAVHDRVTRTFKFRRC